MNHMIRNLAILGVGTILVLPSQAEVIEEVVVTAQKRTQSVQDIGLSVSAISDDDLRGLRIEDFNDIKATIPNLDIKNTLGGLNPAITLRGVGLNDFNANNNPAVGVYVDEVFLSSPGFLTFNLLDVERVEVLKGPQGTLYGRNTSGGAVNFVTKKPTNEFEAYIDVGVGNFSSSKVTGAISGPLTENWSGRFAARYDRQGKSYWDNKLGSDFEEAKSYTARGQLRYEDDRTTVNVSLAHTDAQFPMQPYKSLAFGDPADPFVIFSFCPAAQGGFATSVPQTGGCISTRGETVPDQDPWNVSYADDLIEDNEYDASFFVGTVTRDLTDNLAVTSVTGWATMDRDYFENITESPSGFNYISGRHDEELDQFSQELRLTSLGEKLNWHLGVFYSKDKAKSNFQSETEALPGLPTRFEIVFDQEVTSFATYAHAEYAFSEQWEVVGGLRYTDENLDYVGGFTDLNPTNSSWLLALFAIPLDAPFCFSCGTVIDVDDTDVSGRIGLNFRPDDDWLIYGSVSKGFKSGIAFADFTFSPQEVGPIDAENLWAYEVGFKSTLGDGSVQLNGAVFYYDYKDLQTRVPTLLAFTFTNVDEAEITGAELELLWLPTARLELRAGLGWLDSEITDDGADGFLEGNELPSAPEFQWNAVVRYTFDLSDGYQLDLRTSAKSSATMYQDAVNYGVIRSDSYTLVDAAITLYSQDNDWELSLWGKNLTEDSYREWSLLADSFTMTSDIYNAPRTYGISFHKYFGQ